MIIFHEGLPGSGKSYATMKDHIVPSLKKGRAIWAYLEGLDNEKIAEVSELPVEEVNRLLRPMTREEVLSWPKLCPNDCLVIIDELQNFYPSGKSKLDDVTTQAVTEHRHKGQDIIGMGQDIRDCHSLFKRRVDQKILFNKLDALGFTKRYSWQVCKSAGLERFEVISKGVGSYDPKYFGTYKSHVDGAENKSTFEDSRANIFKSKFFRYILPLSLALGCVAVWKVSDVFTNGFSQPKKVATNSAGFPIASSVVPGANVLVPSQPAPPTAVKPPSVEGPKEPMLPSERPISAPQDRVQILSEKYRLRVGGYWEGRGKKNGFIEWRDDNNTLKNRFTFDEMQGFGYTVMSNQFGTVATIVNGPIHFVATAWGLDSNSGVMNQQQQESVRGSQSASSSYTPPAAIQKPSEASEPYSMPFEEQPRQGVAKRK